MNVPDPRDVAGVISRIRRDGSVMWPVAALPDDFLGWRRLVRAAAREANLRISVRRVNDVAFVDTSTTWSPTTSTARFNKVIQAQVDGRQISWDDALHEAAGDRVRLLPDHHHPNGRSDVDG